MICTSETTASNQIPRFAENRMGVTLRRVGFVLSSLPTASVVTAFSLSPVGTALSPLPFSGGWSHHQYLSLSSGEFTSLDFTSSPIHSRLGRRRAKGKVMTAPVGGDGRLGLIVGRRSGAHFFLSPSCYEVSSLPWAYGLAGRHVTLLLGCESHGPNEQWLTSLTPWAKSHCLPLSYFSRVFYHNHKPDIMFTWKATKAWKKTLKIGNHRVCVQ